MNYRIAYSRFIGKVRRRGDTQAGQLHHVLPVCLGGKDGETVRVTQEEHDYAHFLLNLALCQEGRRGDAARIGFIYRPKSYRMMRRHAFSKLVLTVTDQKGRTTTVKLAEAGARLALIRPEVADFPKKAWRPVKRKLAFKCAMRALGKAVFGDGRYFAFKFGLAGEKPAEAGA